MPKASRRKVSRYTHEASAKVTDRQFAVNDNAVEHVEVGSQLDVPANDILQAMSEDGHGTIQKQLKKKEKQALKHETLLQRLESTRTPYSKSHERRLKRKAKEQVAGGLDDMQHAIAVVAQEVPSADAVITIGEDRSEPPSEASSKPKTGLIGEGKNAPLTKSQRKRALQTERLRVPMILSNPEFASNPFQTLRTHAENTLVKHHTSE